MAVETLLEQKRRAAADYQESQKNQTGTSTQAGGTGTAKPISSGATPRSQGETDPNRLSDIIGALGDTAVGENQRAELNTRRANGPQDRDHPTSDLARDQSFTRGAKGALYRKCHSVT
ncbi:hypothetical protein PCANC_05361 [Puccinia coronata f. sp. avenae]|uniref:Uncharacterized protein n=1 Tax=Puccinia coronata f. sp. avenae TaxID=200324 RepID=A0A2N5SU71_9BASI|nr:hypothetical protein PCANC_15378 [Puccinia coronata f. sp. avenae]PLW54622.1 hypothetical protein PCANC_05361 [Puccinia coronata f. sp. avenae]